MTAPARPAQRGKANTQQQAKPRSFLLGTQSVFEGGDYDQTYTATNGANATPWVLSSTGWLRGLYLQFTGTGLTAGTVTADAPFNILSNIQLNDVNNEAIFGPFDGYSAFVANKYGGYMWLDDPATQSNFALSGTTTTNNFTFFLWIPIEIVERDPIGDVASVNNVAALQLVMVVNQTANVFSTPTGTLAVRIRGTQVFFWQPRTNDKSGNQVAGAPVSAGTTQYWTQGSVPITGGTILQQLQTALGYPFRSYALVYRDASGSRSAGETNWPDPLISLKFEANMLLTNIAKALWQVKMSREYGYNSGTADTRGPTLLSGKENGVYMLNWNQDFMGWHPGSETRRTYLQTDPGSNFIINGAFGVAGNLFSLVNYVSPATAGTGKAQGPVTPDMTGGK